MAAPMCARPNTPPSNPKDVGALTPILRDRIYTAQHDAPKRLTLVSGHRDPGKQYDLRRQRCPGRECSAACKGYPITALPATYNPKTGQWEGGSKHQRRQAADMGGYGLDWLIANRERYGLALTVRSERWHFEADAIDVLTGRRHNRPTVRILAYGSKDVPVKKKAPALKYASRGAAVTVLKTYLNDIRHLTGAKKLSGTAVFDMNTKRAVEAFQSWNNRFLDLTGDRKTPRLTVDGVVGELTSTTMMAWVAALRGKK